MSECFSWWERVSVLTLHLEDRSVPSPTYTDGSHKLSLFSCIETRNWPNNGHPSEIRQICVKKRLIFSPQWSMLYEKLTSMHQFISSSSRSQTCFPPKASPKWGVEHPHQSADGYLVQVEIFYLAEYFQTGWTFVKYMEQVSAKQSVERPSEISTYGCKQKLPPLTTSWKRRRQSKASSSAKLEEGAENLICQAQEGQNYFNSIIIRIEYLGFHNEHKFWVVFGVYPAGTVNPWVPGVDEKGKPLDISKIHTLGHGFEVHSGAAVKSKWIGSSGRSEPKLNSTPTPKYNPNLNHKTASHKMLPYVLFGGGSAGGTKYSFQRDHRGKSLVFLYPSDPADRATEPAGRVELLVGAAGCKAGQPSSYAVCGMRTSGQTLSGDLDSDPDLREVGLERWADGWPLKRGTYTAGG
ncbi:hypothetical protein B0H19DRAFT_1058361 [Mycena capillaripes]|nr:hypothetical protein B0H19DRAFT_1058361 [Mycena capillaripes]